MKALKALVLAWLGWAWSFIVALWGKAKVWGDYLYDPPPHHIKWWLGIGMSLIIGGAWFGGTVVSWFDRSVLGPLHSAAAPVVQPVMLLPRNSIIPSAMPVKPAEAPKSADLAPLAPLVAPPLPKAPAAPVKLYKAKKAKPAGSSPFPN